MIARIPTESSTLIEQLRALGRASVRKRSFVIRDPAGDVEVEYEIDDSGERALLLTTFPSASEAFKAGYRGRPVSPVKADRPIAVYLRAETLADRVRKAVGTTGELQTGDAEFDAAVLIETQTEHEVARALLEQVGARAAIVRLLQEGCSSILLDDWSGKVMVHLPKVGSPTTDGQLATRLVRCVIALRSALPPVERPRTLFSTARKDDSARYLLLAGPGLAIATAAIGSLVAGLVTLIFFLALTPDSCWSQGQEPGTKYLVCQGPRCCEPLNIGLSWGSHIVLVLWGGLVILWFVMLVTRKTEKTWIWPVWAVTAGLAIPVGLAVGVMAARLAY